MSDDMTKARKKEAKAAAKIEKARAKAAGAGHAAIEEDGSAFRTGLLRFVKEGAFQTIVKIVAGLVVGYLLIRFGLR